MSDAPKIHEFDSLEKLVDRLRDDFVSGHQDFLLIYAYNGTGKTRISMQFKDTGKAKNDGNPDTLYYNAIAVACDQARLLRQAKDRVQVVFSSHHALFFNVMVTELKKLKHKKYFLNRPNRGNIYTLRATDDTPFFHHVAMLSEMQKAAESGALFTYHFNLLRSIMEKTATFFGHKDFSTCIAGMGDEALYSRALNLMSHGRYSLAEPTGMLEDNKNLFRQIPNAFLNKYQFDLPEVLNAPAATAASAS